MSENLPIDLVYALAFTQGAAPFRNGAVCFAATSTGLLRSTDGGATWEPAYASLNLDETIPTTDVVITPDFDNDHSVFAGVSGGVFRSSDGGETWQATALSSPPPTITALVISPNYIEDGILLAGTMEDGVFRSRDRGSSWSVWNFGLLDLNVLCLAISPDFAEDETLFAGVDSGIFRSTNGGRAWREVNLPFGFDPVISLKLSPNYAQDGILFAGTESQGLWRSADRGATWTRLGEDVIDTPVNSIVLAVDFTNDPSILVLLESALYLSRDGGQQWHVWPVDADAMTAVAAPNGFDAPLLVGLVGGDVIQVPPISL